MIIRRQFLGSLGTFCAVHGLAIPNFSRTRHPATPQRLNWSSKVISMEPHAGQRRAAVVTDLSLQPNGQQLAIVGDDHFICIYDLAAGQFVRNLKQHTDWVRCSRYSPDGKTLVTAGNDRQLAFWDASDFASAPTLRRHQDAIIGIDFTPDSTKLATVGFDNLIRIYDVASRTLLRKMTCSSNDNHAVAFSNDHQWVAAGGRNGSIQVWEVDSGKLVSEFRCHRRRIRSLVFNERGEILSCGDDQVVNITQPASGKQAGALPRQTAKIFDFAVLDGGLLATAGTDNQVNLWRLSDNEFVGFLKGHTGTVSCLDADRNKIVSGSFDTQVRVWQIKQDFIAALPGMEPAKIAR